MTQPARPICSTITLAFVFTLAIAASGFLINVLVAQSAMLGNGVAVVSETVAGSSSHLLSVAKSDVEEEGVQPVWRYTRFGWQDANEWTSLNQIVHPPQRGLDRFHPLTLAMLILFSVLAAVLWASNEWEVAQLFGSERSDFDTLDRETTARESHRTEDVHPH